MARKFLKLFINFNSTRLPFLAPLLTLGLTGCISATGEILGDAKAILGERIQVHAFASPLTGSYCVCV